MGTRLIRASVIRSFGREHFRYQKMANVINLLMAASAKKLRATPWQHCLRLGGRHLPRVSTEIDDNSGGG